MAKPPTLGRQKTLDDMAQGSTAPRHLGVAEPISDSAAEDKAGQEDDPILRVQVLGPGHFYNNHPLPMNAVIELPASVVDLHREQGYQLGPVADDYDGEIYDHSVEWQHPNNERETAKA